MPFGPVSQDVIGGAAGGGAGVGATMVAAGAANVVFRDGADAADGDSDGPVTAPPQKVMSKSLPPGTCSTQRRTRGSTASIVGRDETAGCRWRTGMRGRRHRRR